MTLGFGIATAIFNAVEQKPSLASFWDVKTQPYTATFWYSVACAGLSVCLVPLLTIGTQGGKAKVDKMEAVRRLQKSEGNVRLAIEDSRLEL